MKLMAAVILINPILILLPTALAAATGQAS